ncbi:MAG: ParB/RepB/Spo0J family partition protein [Solirubrobacterales bacterium]
MAKRGMGRGLAAILPDPEQREQVELRMVPADLVKPNPNQPRKRIDPESISALAESVAAAGVIQPLIVRPLADGTYELIAGERRWRAAREVGLDEVPAVVRDEDEPARLQTALIENMAREDLNPVDEARACATLVEDLGLSKEEVGRRVGRSRPAISNLIRILDLPDDALGLIEAGELSEGHGRAILQAKGNDVRRRLARDAARGGWSVRETERRAKRASSVPIRGRVTPHPDQQAALGRAADELESALGHEVAVSVKRHGLRAELHFDDLEQALSFARSLATRRAA